MNWHLKKDGEIIADFENLQEAMEYLQDFVSNVQDATSLGYSICSSDYQEYLDSPLDPRD
jgi:hypothetical protein